jgi:hypothetical protein
MKPFELDSIITGISLFNAQLLTVLFYSWKFKIKIKTAECFAYYSETNGIANEKLTSSQANYDNIL